MLLRVGLGALLIAHGVQKAFGLWGGQGLNGFQQSLVDMGYQHANIGNRDHVRDAAFANGAFSAFQPQHFGGDRGDHVE